MYNLLKNNKEGRRLFLTLTGQDYNFRELIRDNNRLVLIDNNGAVIGECSEKLTQFLIENKIVEVEWI